MCALPQAASPTIASALRLGRLSGWSSSKITKTGCEGAYPADLGGCLLDDDFARQAVANDNRFDDAVARTGPRRPAVPTTSAQSAKSRSASAGATPFGPAIRSDAFDRARRIGNRLAAANRRSVPGDRNRSLAAARQPPSAGSKAFFLIGMWLGSVSIHRASSPTRKLTQSVSRFTKTAIQKVNGSRGKRSLLAPPGPRSSGAFTIAKACRRGESSVSGRECGR